MLPSFDPRRVVRLAALLLPLATGLAGCGASTVRFPPACPRASIVGSAADLTRFRGDASAGGGQDVTDMVFSGRITGVTGTCERSDEETLGVTATVGLDLTRVRRARPARRMCPSSWRWPRASKSSTSGYSTSGRTFPPTRTGSGFKATRCT